jgi:hypothetical protein
LKARHPVRSGKLGNAGPPYIYVNKRVCRQKLKKKGKSPEKSPRKLHSKVKNCLLFSIQFRISKKLFFKIISMIGGIILKNNFKKDLNLKKQYLFQKY